LAAIAYTIPCSLFIRRSFAPAGTIQLVICPQPCRCQCHTRRPEQLPHRSTVGSGARRSDASMASWAIHISSPPRWCGSGARLPVSGRVSDSQAWSRVLPCGCSTAGSAPCRYWFLALWIDTKPSRNCNVPDSAIGHRSCREAGQKAIHRLSAPSNAIQPKWSKA